MFIGGLGVWEIVAFEYLGIYGLRYFGMWGWGIQRLKLRELKEIVIVRF